MAAAKAPVCVRLRSLIWDYHTDLKTYRLNSSKCRWNISATASIAYSCAAPVSSHWVACSSGCVPTKAELVTVTEAARDATPCQWLGERHPPSRNSAKAQSLTGNVSATISKWFTLVKA